MFISQHIYKGKIILYNNQNLIPSLSLWLLVEGHLGKPSKQKSPMMRATKN